MVDRVIREARLHQEDKRLLVAALKFLKSLDDLFPEEKFFYRDLICKILHLPQVIHFKSSTDQTMIAGAISMAKTQWRDLKKDILLK